MPRAKSTSTPSFEQQLDRLEQIVEVLDRGDAPLDELLKLYEEGMTLTQTCRVYLETARQKIVIIDNQTSASAANAIESEDEF
jgi:exodeoxyribonuclease VII small subunit